MQRGPPSSSPALAYWSDASICYIGSSSLCRLVSEDTEVQLAEQQPFGWVTYPLQWSTAWAMSNSSRTTHGWDAGCWRKRWASFFLFLICCTCSATWLSHDREAAQQPATGDNADAACSLYNAPVLLLHISVFLGMHGILSKYKWIKTNCFHLSELTACDKRCRLDASVSSVLCYLGSFNNNSTRSIFVYCMWTNRLPIVVLSCQILLADHILSLY